MMSTTVHTTYVAPGKSTKVFTNMLTIDGYHLYTIASAAAQSELSSAYVEPATSLTIEVYSDNTI